MTVVPTPSQTAGPFVEIGVGWDADGLIVPDETPGCVSVSGIVRDGLGEPVTDAVIEVWQSDIGGFTRALTVRDGRYQITTVKPGAVEDEDGTGFEAPHLALSVFARGLLQRLVTYVYFEDETAANARDPFLAALESSARDRLLARSVSGGYRFDIALQGEGETPFFVP